MARRIHVAAHLSTDELGRRYRQARDRVERSRWQMLWLLSEEQHAALGAALAEPAPNGGEWTGPSVAPWMRRVLGRPISRSLGWVYPRRLGLRQYMPRLRHVHAADAAAQEAFQGGPQAEPGCGRRPSGSDGRAVGAG